MGKLRPKFLPAWMSNTWLTNWDQHEWNVNQRCVTFHVDFCELIWLMNSSERGSKYLLFLDLARMPTAQRVSSSSARFMMLLVLNNRKDKLRVRDDHFGSDRQPWQLSFVQPSNWRSKKNDRLPHNMLRRAYGQILTKNLKGASATKRQDVTTRDWAIWRQDVFSFFELLQNLVCKFGLSYHYLSWLTL